MYRVVEREKYAPDYKYEEEYDTIETARFRVKDLYHQTAIEGDPDLIESADHGENWGYASVVFRDGNEVSWDIEND